MAVTATGDLYVANALAGFSAPTKIVGDVSKVATVVSKVSASGRPVFAVEIGGSYVVDALSVDSGGNVLIAGKAPATGLPVTAGAYRSSSSGDLTAYVCKLNSADGALAFCTYLGSNQIDISAIGTDSAGNVYVLAKRNDAALPPTPGALSLGSRQIVVIKLDPAGSKLLYTAEFGGSVGEGPSAMTVDASGSVYITGGTASPDFPATAGGAIPTLSADTSASFVAKVNASGTAILYASYGRAFELTTALAVDTSGEIHVLGITATNNIFVRKYSADASAIVYERTLAQDGGGSGPAAIAVDELGVASIIGNTSLVNFPVHRPTATCHFTNVPRNVFGAADGFLVRLSPGGELLQSTFLPSDGSTLPVAIAAQSTTAYVATGFSDNLARFAVLQLGPDLSGGSETVLGCMGSAATLAGNPLAPGEIVSIFGEHLGPAAPASWTFANGRIASALAGVEVTFDGVPAPLLYVQDSQINAITPWTLAGKSVTQMCATYLFQTHCATAGLRSAAPAMFLSGPGYAAAINQDGTVNSPKNPAPVGSVVSLYLTGLGPMSPVPPDGTLIGLPLPKLTSTVQVWFPNPDFHLTIPTQGEVLYAGPAPLEVGGLFQINVRIPYVLTNAGPWVVVLAPDGESFQSPAALIATK